jgi:aspartyl-tRNA synthetase
LVAIKIKDSDWESTLNKYFGDAQRQAIIGELAASDGDLILIVADQQDIVLDTLGTAAAPLAREENWVPSDRYEFTWIVDFPLFEYSKENSAMLPVTTHHFTQPGRSGQAASASPGCPWREPMTCLEWQRDCWCSIRISDEKIQAKCFRFWAFPIKKRMTNLAICSRN